MADISIARSMHQAVVPIAFDAYLEQASISLDPFCHVHDATNGQDNPVVLEWTGGVARVSKWTDSKTLSNMLGGHFAVPIDKYYNAVEWDRVDIRFKQHLHRAEEIGKALGRGMALKPVSMMIRALRENPLAYDNQPLFDAEHKHEDEDGETTTYSNVDVAFEVADLDVPSIAEAKALIHSHRERLVDNQKQFVELVSAEQVARSLTIIVNSPKWFTSFNQVRTMDTIDQKTNELKGAFQLYLDVRPNAGTSSYVTSILSEPGGARPLIMVEAQKPDPVQDLTRWGSDGKVIESLEALAGIKPGWPQSTMQTRPVAAS